MGVVLPFDPAAGIIAPGGPQTRNPRYFAVPQGLLGYWGFDADCAISSTLSADLSGFGHHATLIGSPPLAQGQVGLGLSCNGTNQAASAAIDLSGTNIVTLVGWLNQTTFANADRVAFLYTADFSTNAGAIVVATSSSDFGGGNTMEFGAHGGGGTFNLYGVVQPSAGAWHHYALVISTVQGQQAAYIDGVSKSLSTLLQTGDSSAFANSTLYMMSKAGTSQFDPGILDNLKLYPRKLDPWEVAQDYQAGLAGRRDAGAWLPGECEMPALVDTGGPIPLPVPLTGGARRHARAATYYDRPKRVILPNGERIEIETQEQYFRLMDDLIAGSAPEAIEAVPAPTPGQVKRAKAKVAQAALKLDVPAALIEQRIAEQIATHHVEAEKRAAGYPVTRLSLRAKRLAPTLRDQMEWAEVARLIREAIAAEDDEEDAFMQMVAGLL